MMGESKGYLFRVRLTIPQRDKLKKLAADSQRTASEVVRLLIEQGTAEQLGIPKLRGKREWIRYGKDEQVGNVEALNRTGGDDEVV